MSSKKLPLTAYGGIDGKDYVPFVEGGETKKNESNSFIIIVGILLAALFAASTAYSGMKAGLTVAAGIPGAVLGAGILRACRKNNILGVNLIQGMSSAGESVASGVIFVLPAVLVIGADFTFVEAALTGMAGTVLGIAVAAIVHNYMIVEEHGRLLYPESMAISETLVTTDSGGESLKYMGIGAGVGVLFTMFSDSFLNLANNYIVVTGQKAYKWFFGVNVSPLLLGIGFIVGLEVSVAMFAGSILAKELVTPIMAHFAGGLPDTITAWNNPSLVVNSMGASAITNTYTKYIGAGAMLGGGFIGAIKLIPVIVTSLKETLSNKSSLQGGGNLQKYILLVGIVLSFLTAFVISEGNLTMVIVGTFFSILFILIFVIVAGRLTGTVGTSNLPVSGMTIASLVILTLVFVSLGFSSPENNKSLLLFGTIIVTAIAMGGGYLQSQKVSFIVGGSKEKMQINFLIAGIIGVISVSAVLLLLKGQIAIRGEEATFAIPQAELMATLTAGIMEGNLPWTMIFAGIALAIVLFLLKLPIMTVAIGFYLPMETVTIILIGALIRVVVEKLVKDKKEKEVRISNGVSLSAGLVAGSSIMGIVGIALIMLIPAIVYEPAGFLASNWFALIQLIALVGITFYFIYVSKPKYND